MKKKLLNALLLVSVGSCFADDSTAIDQDDTQNIMQTDVLDLNDFSKQFEGQCPSVISQEDWNNYLLRLQMLSNVAADTDPSTAEKTENMLLTLGMNCKAEAAILLNSLPPVDAENADQIKDTVNQICEQYIKSVSDTVVSEDLNAGNTALVEQVIQDLNENNQDAAQNNDEQVAGLDASAKTEVQGSANDQEDTQASEQVVEDAMDADESTQEVEQMNDAQDDQVDQNVMDNPTDMDEVVVEEVQPMDEVQPEEVVEIIPMTDDEEQPVNSMEQDTADVVDSAE
jgi:hypothetical protein